MNTKTIFAGAFVFFASVSTFCAGAAQAQTADQERSGFYFHGHLGGGLVSHSLSVPGETSVDLSGGGPSLGLIFGGAISPNLILHGELMGYGASEPELQTGDVAVALDDVSISFSGVGPGLTYYIMPINIYVGGAILLTTAELEVDGEKFETDLGLGLVLRAGKEFSMTESLGVTIGAQVQVGRLPDKDNADATVSTSGVGITFGLTYN